MKKFLKFLDFNGDEVRLFINQSTRYKTLSGGIISLMVIISCSFILIYNLIQFFTNRSLHVLVQTQFSKEFKPINLTNDTYSTVFHFTQNNGTLDTVRSYNLTLNQDYNLQSNLSKRSEINLGVSNCSNTNIIQKMAELVDDSNKKLFFKSVIGPYTYCQILFDNSTYFIGGDMIYSGINSFIITNFTVSFCNQKCNQDNITNFINNRYYFNMPLIDSYPNMTSSEGFAKFLNLYGFFLDFTKDYVITINYQNNRITTDEGYFYATPKNNTSFFNIKSISQSMTNRLQVNGDINFYIFTNMDRNENVYLRTYQKLGSFVADTRALAYIIYQIFFFLNTIINYKKLEIKLINLLFGFNLEKPIINDSQNRRNSIKINLVNEEIVTYHLKGQKLNSLQCILKKKFESEILRRENNKINHTCNDLFCENKKKFDFGEELLKFHLDVKVVLKQFFDLEKMKSLLYNNDELKVLKLITEQDQSFKENFLRENFLFKNEEKLDDITKSLAKFILNGKNKKMKKNLLDYLKMKFI